MRQLGTHLRFVMPLVFMAVKKPFVGIGIGWRIAAEVSTRLQQMLSQPKYLLLLLLLLSEMFDGTALHDQVKKIIFPFEVKNALVEILNFGLCMMILCMICSVRIVVHTNDLIGAARVDMIWNKRITRTNIEHTTANRNHLQHI